MKISVSILKEVNNYKNAIEKINNSNADFIHLDIMDKTFTKKESFYINNFKNIVFKKDLDIHLMSSNLDKLINEYSKLNPKQITFHYEVGDTLKYIDKLRSLNINVGLAINPDTEVSEIKSFLDKIDYLLIMSVVPGEGGQTFIKNSVNKVKEAYELKKDYNYLIGIDGGINDKTINKIKDYVDIVVSGSYVTDSEDYDEKINTLKKKN